MPTREAAKRRDVLKTIGAGTGAGTGLTTAVRPVSATGPQKKIIVLADGEQAARTEWVSKRWHDQTKAARRAVPSLMSRFKQNPAVVRATVETDDSRIGRLRAPRVLVTVTSSDDPVTTQIPAETNGIPVRIQEGQPATPTACNPDDAKTDCYLNVPDEVFGGLAIEADNSSDTEVNGTTCCRAYVNGNKYILTARHLFTSDINKCNFSDIYDGGTKYLYLDSESAEQPIVGTPQHDFPDSDAVLVDNSDTDRPITYELTDTSESGIVGRVTGDGLDYLKSADETVEKRGRCSCVETGQIYSTAGIETCGNLNTLNGWTKSTTDQRARDSGGIVFYEDSGNKKYIAHIAVANPDDGSYDTLGTSGNHMNKKHGITFGGNPYDT